MPRPEPQDAFSAQDAEIYFGEQEFLAEQEAFPFTPDGDWDDGIYYPGDDA